MPSPRHRGKRGGGILGRFAALPHAYFCTPEFAALSGRAVKLLIAIELQYDGKNNGDLSITRATMRERGFTSADQLIKARDELLTAGWIFVTRQGGRHLTSLYALSYRAIERNDGKHDVRPGPPRHLWRPDQAQWREGRGGERKPRPRPKARTTEQIGPYNGTPLARTTEQQH